MAEQKLRTFKLIDREGFINSYSSNEGIIESHLKNGVLKGVVDYAGDLKPSTEDCIGLLISKNEFKFFEEIFEDEGEEFIPTLDEPCEVSRADDLETWFKFIPRAKYVPYYLKEECYVGDFQSRDVSWKVSQISTEHFVFRPIKVKKTWQDVAQEFIKNDPVLSKDKFVEDMFSDEYSEYHEPMKQLAKLIVEKSGD